MLSAYLLETLAQLPAVVRSVFLQRRTTPRAYRQMTTASVCTALLLLLLFVVSGYQLWLTFHWRYSTNFCADEKLTARRRFLPAATSEPQIRAELSQYLSPAGLLVCQKLMRLGGETVMFGADNTTLRGDFVVCVDKEQQMALQSCSASVFTSCQDRSFARAASRFGCVTHVWPPCPDQDHEQKKEEEDGDRVQVPQQPSEMDRLLDQVPSGTIGFLAVSASSDQVAQMLDQLPETLCERVQQLGLVLDLGSYQLEQPLLAPAAVDNGVKQLTGAAVQLLYQRLSDLQRCGLVPFDLEDVETDTAVRVSFHSGHDINSIIRVGFLRSMCDGAW